MSKIASNNVSPKNNDFPEKEQFKKLSFSKLVKTIGPGIILTGIAFGPGSLTTASMIGATSGYQLLWIFFPIAFMGMSFVLSSHYISINCNMPIIHAIRYFFGNGIAKFVGITLFISCTFFTIGNITGLGAGLNLMTGINWKLGATFLIIILIAIYFSKNVYNKIEKIITFCLLGIILAFLYTLVAAGGIDIKEAGKGLVNWKAPAGTFIMALGFLGSSANITTGIYGTYLGKEKGWTKKDLYSGTILADTIAHILGIVIISGLILLVGAIILHPQGIKISAPAQLAKMVAPIMGTKLANFVMGFALFASAFAALSGNTTRSVVLLNAGFNRETNFESNDIKWVSLVIIIISAIICFLYGGSPTQLILISNVLTNVATPVAGYFICRLMWKKEVFGSSKTPTVLSACMVISYIIYLIFTVYALFGNLIKLINIF